MPHTPTGRPNGRPRKEVTLSQVEKLFAIGCTQEEVAAFVGVSVDTLSRREGFADSQERGKGKAKVSLRRAQFKSALAGNSRLLTWLGMQMLGQRNQTSTELSGPGGGPIQTEDLTKLTDAELTQLELLLAKAQPAGASPSGDRPPQPERVRDPGLASVGAGD